MFKRQAKASESIQLWVCKYTLGCSLTTCDEPAQADLGLQTLKSRRDFHKLKWYHKVMHLLDIRLSAMLLSTKWERVKCTCCPGLQRQSY